MFSVIVPTKGRPKMLSEALGSVMEQTVDDFECIVVDDTGTGDVQLPPDRRIRLVLGQAAGAGAARNVGLSCARGRHVTFLDDDDLLTSDRLEIALKGIAAAPIAVCWRASVEGRGRAWRVSLEGDIGWRVLQGPVPHVGQVAIERAACPMFDPRFRVSEDVEWWIRTARIGHATTVHRVGYLQRDHGGDRQTTRLRERLSHRLLLLEVHADYFDANPRAAAYQWRRIGGLARATGDRALEHRAFRRSLELNPGWRSLAHFGRSCLGTSTNHGN